MKRYLTVKSSAGLTIFLISLSLISLSPCSIASRSGWSISILVWMKFSLFCPFRFFISRADGRVGGVFFFLSMLFPVTALSISSLLCCSFSFLSKKDAKYLSLSLVLTVVASMLSLKSCAIFLTRSTVAMNYRLTLSL